MDVNVPAENLRCDEIDLPAGTLPDENHTLHHQQPQRERHPPRRISYDQLGIHSCYSIQPVLVYHAPGLVPWLPPLQLYYFQPSFMYGLQQVLTLHDRLLPWTMYGLLKDCLYTVNAVQIHGRRSLKKRKILCIDLMSG